MKSPRALHGLHAQEQLGEDRERGTVAVGERVQIEDIPVVSVEPEVVGLLVELHPEEGIAGEPAEVLVEPREPAHDALGGRLVAAS